MAVALVAPGDRYALAPTLITVVNKGPCLPHTTFTDCRICTVCCNDHGIPVMIKVHHILRKAAMLSSLQEQVCC
jgi:hypothetical protein